MAGVGAASGITMGVTPAPASTRAASSTKLSPRKRGSRPTRTRCGFGLRLHVLGNARHGQPDVGHGKLVGHNGPPARGAKLDCTCHVCSPFVRQRPDRKVHTASRGGLGKREAEQVRGIANGRYNTDRGMISMPERSDARIVLTTAASRDEAARLGRSLVEERLAACATLIPGGRSPSTAGKAKLNRPTRPCCCSRPRPPDWPALEARLHALHSYETPEFLVLRVESGSQRLPGVADASLELAKA